MRLRNWCLPSFVAAAIAAGSPLPAQAGWGSYVGRSIVNSLVRQAASRLIQRSLQEMNAPGAMGGGGPYGGPYGGAPPGYPAYQPQQYNYYNSRPAPTYHHNHVHKSTSAHVVHHSSSGGSSSYSSREDDSLVPPPPPSTYSAPSLDLDSGSAAGFNGHEVPPPPPAPSLWKDGMPPAHAATRHGGSLQSAFEEGTAGGEPFDKLVSDGVFSLDPMHGGIHKRATPVRYIILHSTETGSEADADKVIESWSRRGQRHPGAQFVVDRDGTIYATTNPDNATSHIDSHRVIGPYTNDNSIGIELVRTGTQVYTGEQLGSLVHLVAYLQQHYHVPDQNITTHHHVQPSNRRDPVNFDWTAFEEEKRELMAQAASQLTATAMPKPAPPLTKHYYTHDARHHT